MPGYLPAMLFRAGGFMFLKTEEATETVTISFDGRSLRVPANISVAAALLSEGTLAVRTSLVGRQPRAPYCLMGVCFECLVTINGAQNRQACMTLVQDGMEISSQHGARIIEQGGH